MLSVRRLTQSHAFTIVNIQPAGSIILVFIQQKLLLRKKKFSILYGVLFCRQEVSYFSLSRLFLQCFAANKLFEPIAPVKMLRDPFWSEHSEIRGNTTSLADPWQQNKTQEMFEEFR